jgi:hypothetical protein
VGKTIFQQVGIFIFHPLGKTNFPPVGNSIFHYLGNLDYHLHWSYYHRYIQSGRAFYWLQYLINRMLIKWAKKRHRKRSLKWIWNHYWNISKTKRKFSCRVKVDDGKSTIFSLTYPPDIRLARYIKIKGEANPFDPFYKSYFTMREQSDNIKLLPSRKLLPLVYYK